MKRILCSLLIPFIISCANSKSQFTKSEEVIIKPLRPKKNDQGLLQIESLITGIAPHLIDFGIKQLNKIIDKESEKYTADYNASLVDDEFYILDSLGTGNSSRKLNTIGFELTRTARHKKKDSAPKITTEMKFGIEPSKDNNFFRFVPLSIQIYNTKAKLRKKDNDVDITINIKVFGYWVNSKQEYKSELLSESNIELKKIRLDGKYTLSNTNEFLSISGSSSISNNKSDWVPMIPLSMNKNGQALSHSQGNYKILVTISEFDEFGERVKKIKEIIDNNQDNIIEELQNLIDKE